MNEGYFEVFDWLDIPEDLIDDWCPGEDFMVLKNNIVATKGGCIMVYDKNKFVYYPPDLWEALKARKILNDTN